MNVNQVNIVIGGEAGQGLATVGELLSKILVRGGYSIVVTQSYQSRIRGGHNSFAVRAGTERVAAPREPIDILVAMNEETVGMHRPELSDGGLILADEAFAGDGDGCLAIPFDDFPGAAYRNTAALGVVCALLGLDRETAAGSVAEAFGAKKREIADENRETFLAGYAWAAKHESHGRTLPAAEKRGGRLVLGGNQAIALGAVSAGVRFCAFYPMTPATSVPLTLIGMADEMGLVVEQVEDEIAAVNMAIGASYAGAPSMVATSGGGFALMVEGVSLAAMTETPLVIVVAQRPGPATGLPTRTEQADLEFVAFAGHGEFPRAILAPGTVEECFHLTRKAFELAERHQSPIFILTDQFLADSLRDVEPFDVENLDGIRPGADPGSSAAPYLRHRVMDGGVSPRLVPGASGHLVVTDSDEHTEDGHLTEDLAERARQVDKRLAKAKGIVSEAVPPDYTGDGAPDLLFVSWGSTVGAVREAMGAVRAGGTPAASLHFSQVWPLVPEQFVEHLERAGRVVSVEGNATGQLASLIRRASGFDIGERIGRYDGLPITPEYILRALESLGGKRKSRGGKRKKRDDGRASRSAGRRAKRGKRRLNDATGSGA
jgi:2-oxoglutarate ferredoxin oxidoreductase subunit alpha